MDLDKYVKDVGVEIPDGVDDVGIQSLILDAIRSMDDAKWDKLSDETKLWSNELFEGKKPAKLEPEKPAAKGATPKKKVGDPLVKAKVDAKKKSVAVKKDVEGGKLFHAGSNSDDIYQIVCGAGDAGISLDDTIKAAEERPIKSTNIPGRVKDILKMCAKMDGLSCSGLMKLENGKYYAVVQDSRSETKKAKDGEKPVETEEIAKFEEPAPKKPVPKEPAPKKPVPKRPVPKKPVPKKPVPKKPAPKRPVSESVEE
jgi:hypothetical protein